MPQIKVSPNAIAPAEALEFANPCVLTEPTGNCIQLVDVDKVDEYPTSPEKLKEACRKYKQFLHDKGLDKAGFVRAGFFDIITLTQLIRDTESRFVKIYYGIDDGANHFMFLAPTHADGRAREDIPTTLALCCCTRPPCPDNLNDAYAG